MRNIHKNENALEGAYQALQRGIKCRQIYPATDFVSVVCIPSRLSPLRRRLFAGVVYGKDVRSAHMLTFTTDTSEVTYLMERDWRLRHLIETVGDLSYEVGGSAYEHVTHSVIEQMLSMKVGRAIEGRLHGLCGGEITCEAVLSLSVEEIRSCGIAARKAATLQELARTMPEPDLRALAELPDDEVRRALTAVLGIGKWTADMFLIFYLGRPDVLPVEDGTVRQVFRWLYGAPLTDDNVSEVVCSLWRPYSSTAVRYMYRALNLGIVDARQAADALLFG
jgi:DNA-3-methyladenine glycosylase II